MNKFDGTNFTVYRHRTGDTAGLQANEILSLHEDRTGNLWVGASGGSISLYDRKRDAFIHFPANGRPDAIGNNVIRSVCSDHLGKIWIAHFDGLNVLDPVTGRVSKIPLTAGSSFNKVSSCLWEDSRHQMWIGTNEGLFQYNPETKSLAQFVHSSRTRQALAATT